MLGYAQSCSVIHDLIGRTVTYGNARYRDTKVQAPEHFYDRAPCAHLFTVALYTGAKRFSSIVDRLVGGSSICSALIPKYELKITRLNPNILFFRGARKHGRPNCVPHQAPRSIVPLREARWTETAPAVGPSHQV